MICDFNKLPFNLFLLYKEHNQPSYRYPLKHLFILEVLTFWNVISSYNSTARWIVCCEIIFSHWRKQTHSVLHMTDKQSNGKTCQLTSSMAIEPYSVKLLMKTWIYDFNWNANYWNFVFIASKEDCYAFSRITGSNSYKVYIYFHTLHIHFIWNVNDSKESSRSRICEQIGQGKRTSKNTKTVNCLSILPKFMEKVKLWCVH